MHRDWKVDLGPGAAVPAGKYPAKFNFSNIVAVCAGAQTPPLPDFVVFGTGVDAPAASIGAFTNLYNGCPTGPHPANYWGYNTGGKVTYLTRPVARWHAGGFYTNEWWNGEPSSVAVVGIRSFFTITNDTQYRDPKRLLRMHSALHDLVPARCGRHEFFGLLRLRI